MTLDELTALYEKVIQKYKDDLEGDPTHNYKFETSQMFSLAGYQFPFAISYYLVRNSIVRKWLIQYFEKKKDKHIRSFKNGLIDERTLISHLQEKLNDRYLFDKLNREKKRRRNKIKVHSLYRNIFELYISETFNLQGVITYQCYYYDLNKFKLKKFSLVFEKEVSRLIVKGFEELSPQIIYDTIITESQDKHAITFYKNGNDKQNRLHLFLSQGVDNLEAANIITGILVDFSKANGKSFSHEIGLISQSNSSETIKENQLKVKRHLNLRRGGGRAFPKRIFQDPADYLHYFHHRIDHLEPLVGTHLVIRKDKDGHMLVSIFRFLEDYTATLVHPNIKSSLKTPLICVMEIAVGIGKKLHFRVLYPESRTTLITFLTYLSPLEDEAKIRTGYYSGITRIKLINGPIVMYKISTDPDSTTVISAGRINPQALSKITEASSLKIILKTLEKSKNG